MITIRELFDYERDRWKSTVEESRCITLYTPNIFVRSLAAHNVEKKQQ